MADEAELAVSLAMVSLLDLLSKSQDIIPDQNFTRQIYDSIMSLQIIMNNMRHAYHNPQHHPDNATLLVRAREAETNAQDFLVQLLRVYVRKRQLCRFFSATDRSRAMTNMAMQFGERVRAPIQHLESSWTSAPPPENGQQDNRREYRENTRVETHIVGRDESVELLVKTLIGPNTPHSRADPHAPPPPDANIPPPADPNGPPEDADANIPPPVDPNAPPPADANIPPPPAEPNAPPPREDPNAPPPADANIPPPPAEPNAPPPADANAPRTREDPNAPPLEDPLHVIAVVGERNCGKTALVRSVFNSPEIKHHFDCRAWVRVADVGPQSWTEILLVEILLQMPVGDQLKDLKHKNKKELILMLRKLLMERRYLIVLDNLGARRFTDFWDPFEESNGSRIIVTSTEDTMQNMVDRGVEDLQLCRAFNDEECSTLLQHSFTGLEVLSEDLTASILSKCRWSAPKISLLGGLLSATEGRRRVALIDQLGQEPTLDDIKRLSFHELPYHMKPCVLYMALFPKESEVPTRRLFQLWAAEGLLLEREAPNRPVQMRLAEHYFCELERRNLIHVVRQKLDTSARSCRLPAFLHEFFFQMARDFRLLQISPHAEQNAPNQPNQAQNAAAGHHDYMVRYLRSVASFHTCKPGTQRAREIKGLLDLLMREECQRLLRALDLEGVYKPELPKKFDGKLPNLRYLGLRRTALDSIPESVGNLLLLETLDLKHTNITKVTSAIWKAKNLRHLYLSEASFDGPIPPHISTGSNLETLWGLFIETDKSPMISVLRNLKRLTKLGVTCRPGAASAVAECISNLIGLTSLRLRSRDLFGQPAALHLCDNMTSLVHLSNLYLLGSLQSEQNLRAVLPPNLRRLTLSMSGCGDNLMQVLQNQNQLIELRLLARSFSMTTLSCQEAAFPRLRVLKLWMLDNLEEFVIDRGAMVNLEELDIKQCEKLERVTGLDEIDRFTSLRLTKVKEVLDPRRPGPDVRIRVHQRTCVKTTELLCQDPPPVRGTEFYKGGVPHENNDHSFWP